MALRTTPEVGSAARGRLDRLAPALVWLGLRLIGVTVLAVLAGLHGDPVVDELTSWDGDWLLAIATFGYDGVPAGFVDGSGTRTPDTAYGFFPGYPAVVGLFALVIDPVLAGLGIAAIAGVVMAYGLTALATEVVGPGDHARRIGLVLVALVAAAPMAIAFSMAYTEALFCALAVWALVAVLRRHWLLAGALSAGAGLVRPTASALVLAVGLAALVAILRGRDGWRPWAGGALATTGLLGYLGFVALRTGDPAGWSAIQREGWGWYVDGGAATTTWALQRIVDGDAVFELATVATLLGAAVLLAVAIRTRLPWPLIVHGAGVLATVWATDGLMNAKMRLLLPAFVLLVPPAVALARRSTPTVVAVLTAVALTSAWLGAHALTVWPYAI